jgi:hypothetical protein
MDGSAQSDSVLALGRKLVNELGLESSTDTLGRWMAHFVAQLMAKAEIATGENKAAAEKECWDAILTLWRHRGELPNGKRPYEQLEPVMRAVESLDPDDSTPRYYRSVRAPKGEDEEESASEFWLKMVNGLDYSAKLLIAYCLTQAASAAIDKSKEWVKLAQEAGAKDEVPEILISFVSDSSDLGKEPDPNSEARRRLQDRIKRLEVFSTLAVTLIGDLKARLEALPPVEGKEDKSDNQMIRSAAQPFGDL